MSVREYFDCVVSDESILVASCQKIKDVESRLNRGLSARVRVGWLLRIRFVRQGQQSLVICYLYPLRPVID